MTNIIKAVQETMLREEYEFLSLEQYKAMKAKGKYLEAESLKWKEACRKEYLSAIDWTGKTQAAEIDLAAEQHKVKVLTEALAHIRLLAGFESGRNDAEIHETAREALSTVRGK